MRGAPLPQVQRDVTASRIARRGPGGEFEDNDPNSSSCVLRALHHAC